MGKKNKKPKLTQIAALSIAAIGSMHFATNAYAQSTSNTTAETLPKVTVNATRREEAAQDVPIPISSVDGTQLEERRIYQVQDLQQTLPSLNSAFIHGRQSSLAVRGIGNNPANEGLEGSVGLYLDNVFLGRPGMAVFDLLDLEQVDLLRGPQGTLFGKNTTAGVLNISTRKPSFDEERHVETTLGSYGTQQIKAVFNQPLNETIATRLAVYKSDRDGFVKNLYDGRDLSGSKREGARGQVFIQPDSKFDLRLIAEYNKERSTNAYIPYSINQATNAQGSTFISRLTPYVSGGFITDPYKYQVNINGNQHFAIDQSGLSAEANWNLDSGHKLTSITAARKWKFKPHNDLDLTTADGIRDGGFNVEDSQLSQEVRLASPKGEKFDYVVGAYYFHQNISNNSFYSFGDYAGTAQNQPANYNAVFGNLNTNTYGNAKTDSYALFGQTVFHLTPQTDITTGLRYTDESKTAQTQRTQWTDSITPAPTQAALAATRNSLALFGPWDSGSLSRKDKSYSGLLSLSHKFQDNLLGYTSYSSGSKSGGFNINGIGTGPTVGVQSLNVEPEKAQSVEVGFKSTSQDKSSLFNANLFLTKIQGYQTNSYIYDSQGLAKAAIINAGDVETKGIEFEVASQVSRHWALGLNGSYNHANYTSFTKAPPALENNYGNGVGGVADLSGHPVNGAPRWILNTNARYTTKLDNGDNVWANANYAWRSGSYGDISDSEYTWIPSYGVVNLASGYAFKSQGTNWDVSLWVKTPPTNITS